MALTDLKVYSEYAYLAFTEVLRQKIDLFNAASGGALVLASAAHQGDFSQEVFYKKIAGGTVRRRDAYGAGSIAEKVLTQTEAVTVKVAAGTPPIRIDPSQFNWIQRSPEEAGSILGQQLAVDTMADMLNTGLGCVVAALGQTPEVNIDKSASVAPADKITWDYLNQAQALFGDSSADIRVWIMHSKVLHDLYSFNLANAQSLFTYGTINVIRDPFGKLLVMTDSDQLFITGTPNTYVALGLTGAALTIDQNNDFEANEETKNGFENIVRTYQAEWSYNVGVKGYAWDKAVKSPNNAALFTATNWDRYSTSHKDLAGVVLKVH